MFILPQMLTYSQIIFKVDIAAERERCGNKTQKFRILCNVFSSVKNSIIIKYRGLKFYEKTFPTRENTLPF